MQNPVRVCHEPGCPNLTPCEAHPPRRRDRPNARQRGYDARWEATRRLYLQGHPTCETAGCTRQAIDVHHLDLRGPLGPKGHDPTNLRALCHPCHSSITARTTARRRT